jgi:hypothetical protein
MKTATLGHKKFIGTLAALLAFVCAGQAQNMLKNGDFAAMSAGGPAQWKAYGNKQELAQDTEQIFGDSKQSLRVDITTDVGKSLGQIVQKVDVTPGSKYLFKVDMKSTSADVGLGQIKLLVGNSEIKRMATARSGTEWAPVELAFDSGEANVVWVVLRYNQRGDDVGKKVWFANASLTPAP